jgi:hypothetical protein
MKRFSKFVQESVELEEQSMSFQDAEKLKGKHLVAADRHKKSGNSKGYDVHTAVVSKFEDAYDRHGTGVIPAGRILSASQKAFKDHPHSSMKESIELDEAWSDGVSSRNAHTHRSAAAQYRKKANSFASMAKNHEKGSPEHNKHMSAYHSTMAKSIKSSYHAGDYGSMAIAKKDHKAEMARAKEYKSTNESVELDEAVTVKKKDYSWGKMMTVHHGSSHSFPLHPEHQEKIRKLGSGQKTSFKDETGANITAHRDGDTIHLKHPGSNRKTSVARSHFTESVNLEEKLKASDDMGDWVKDFQDSDAPQFKGKSQKKRQQMAIAAKLSANEEVELDEVSTEKLRDYASAALQDKNKAKADKRWKYAGKAMQKVADREVKAAHARKYNKIEEVEQLDELSPKTLKSYMKKSAAQLDKVERDWKDKSVSDKKVANRLSGFDRANKRLKNKEAVELDEASTKVMIPKSRYLTILKAHGPKKLARTPKGEMQYRGAEHFAHNKDTDTHITQTYSHPDHNIATIERHKHHPTGETRYYMYRKTQKEDVDLDEGIVKSYSPKASQPWSKTVKDSANTAGEYKQIAKGKDFTVWYNYGGSLKRSAHYVVRDDKLIGSGWTMNSALKDAGLKDADLTHRSKFSAGSILNKGMKESVELDEAVEVSHDRYMRSHGKKARDTGQSGNWMFTHKRMGDVNYNDDKEVHTARGKFSDAKKSAQQWAKKHGHGTVYVMEEVEQIDEISASTLRSYVDKARVSRDTAKKDRTQAKSDMKKYGNMPGDRARHDAAQRKMVNRAGGISVANKKLGTYPTDRAKAKVMAREEVEQIDEISASTLRSYISKKSQQIIDKDKKSNPYELDGFTSSSKERNRDFDKLNLARKKVREESIVNESVEMSLNQKRALEIGRKLQAMAPKEKNDMISNAMANLADHLESFGATFGPKNMTDLVKKTGLSKEIIATLMRRAQK